MTYDTIAGYIIQYVRLVKNVGRNIYLYYTLLLIIYENRFLIKMIFIERTLIFSTIVSSPMTN